MPSLVSLTGDVIALKGNTYFRKRDGSLIGLITPNGLSASAITAGTISADRIASGDVSVEEVLTGVCFPSYSYNAPIVAWPAVTRNSVMGLLYPTHLPLKGIGFDHLCVTYQIDAELKNPTTDARIIPLNVSAYVIHPELWTSSGTDTVTISAGTSGSNTAVFSNPNIAMGLAQSLMLIRLNGDTTIRRVKVYFGIPSPASTTQNISVSFTVETYPSSLPALAAGTYHFDYYTPSTNDNADASVNILNVPLSAGASKSFPALQGRVHFKLTSRPANTTHYLVVMRELGIGGSASANSTLTPMVQVEHLYL